MSEEDEEEEGSPRRGHKDKDSDFDAGTLDSESDWEDNKQVYRVYN